MPLTGSPPRAAATNTRKLLTVALSFVIFPKPLKPAFAPSGASIAFGVYLHHLRKASDAKAATKAALKTD